MFLSIGSFNSESHLIDEDLKKSLLVSIVLKIHVCHSMENGLEIVDCILIYELNCFVNSLGKMECHELWRSETHLYLIAQAVK